MSKKFFLFAILLLSTVWLAHCSPFDPGMGFGSSRFSVYFTEPGTDRRTGIDKQVDAELVKLIDSAQETLRLSVYNFSLDSVIQAVIRAKNRRIDVKVVGDIDEYYTHGYQEMNKHNVDMHLGNSVGIQHNKFAVVDSKIIFAGTGNITGSDFVRNNNNFFVIEHPEIAQVYEREFMQMYNGLFGVKKKPRSTNQKFVVNNGTLEIFFSPYQGESAMRSLIDLVDNAKHSVHFMIFAYTHDELAASMIRAARHRQIPVYGVHDSTFIVGVSEEAPRLYSASFNNDGSQNAFGPFVVIDGNENTAQEGNPAHGGKMHAKTLIIDAGTDSAIVATGSFNWSTNAIKNNDENMMIVKDARIANAIYEQFKSSWSIGKPLSQKVRNINGDNASSHDIVISEINWAGSKDNNTSANSNINESDDYIELYNRTASPINISHWVIQWGCDTNKNIYPNPDQYNSFYDQDNIISPGEHVVFYNLTNSAFGAPVTVNGSANTAPHFKFSGTKDFRLSMAELKIRIYDKSMNLIDEAGNCKNAPAGLQDNDRKKVASMQRRDYKGANIANGSQSGAWYTATLPCDKTKNLNCLDYDLNTAGTPGYDNGDEIGPNTLSSRFVASNRIELNFDSQMTQCLTASDFIMRKEDTGMFTPSQIFLNSSDAGKVIVESASFGDHTKIYEILPKGVFHKTIISGGLIYAATNAGLAISTDLNASTFEHYTRITAAGALTQLPSVRINSLVINGSDIFIATPAGLAKSNTSGVFAAPTAFFPTAALTDLVYSGTVLYVSSDRGVYFSTDSPNSFNSNSTLLSTTQGLPSNNVRKLFLLAGAPNKILAATDNGLAIIDTSNNSITVKNTGHGLPSNNILSLFYDGTSIFVGTDKGLAKSTDGATGNSWQVYTTAQSLLSNNITALHIDGATWLVGSDKGLSMSLNTGSTFTNKTSASGLKGVFINHITVDNFKIYLSTMSALSISNNMTTSHSYSATSACSDYSNRYSPHNYIHNSDVGFYFNGYNSGSLATVKINEIAMQRSNDFVELYVTSSGSLRGLAIYKYSSYFKTLLYEFNEVYAEQGDYILLELKHPLVKVNQSEDKTLKKSSGLFRVFSSYSGLSGSDDIVMVQNNDGTTLDLVYYSNRSGDITFSMIDEALYDVYHNYQSFWPLPEVPVDGLNDALIQSYGVDVSNVTTANRGIQRSCNGAGVWEYTDSLTPGASNNSANCNP